MLLGGEAGLRCGEIMALERIEVDLRQRNVCGAAAATQCSRRTPTLHNCFSKSRSPSIRASFLRRVHRLSCRSRMRACSSDASASEYANRTGRRVAVKRDARPSLCFKTRAERSSVLPTYRESSAQRRMYTNATRRRCHRQVRSSRRHSPFDSLRSLPSTALREPRAPSRGSGHSPWAGLP